MKLKYAFLLSLLFVLILMATGCSKPDVAPQTPDASKDATNPSLTSTFYEPTGNEKELFNSLAGGFFYSSSKDTEYQLARQEAMVIFNDQVIDVLEACFELMDSLTYSEELIMYYMDDIDQSRVVHKDDFQHIINQIMAYKTAIDALSLEANGYFEIIENYKDNDINKAVINAEIFQCTNDLYAKLDEYISYLVIINEYLATGVADNSDMDYVKTMRGFTDAAFNENVLEGLVNATKSYLVMSNMYAHIATTDYYDAIDTRYATRNTLKSMDQTEEVKSLIKLLDTQMDKPDYLISVLEDPNPEGNSNRAFILPFVTTAYADERVDLMASKAAIGKLLTHIQSKQRINGEVTSDDMDELIFYMLIEQKMFKDIFVQQKIESEKALLNSIPSSEELYTALTGISSKKKVPLLPIQDPEVKALRFFDYLEITTDQFVREGSTENTAPISNNIQAVKHELISKDLRDEMIEKLKNAQNTPKDPIDNLFLNLVPSSIGDDLIYDKVISNFVNVLKENKGEMNNEMFSQINDLLNNDLEHILGDKKADFANKFLNASAENMVNTFSDWVNNSRNNQNLSIDKNALIDLLDQMGFEHAGIKDATDEQAYTDDTVDDSPNNTDETSENAVLDKNELLLDYLTYMLPYMENLNHDDLVTASNELGLSPEEYYIYVMSSLSLIFKDEEDYTPDEKRVIDGLTAYIQDGKDLDPWVKDFCFNTFYDLFNENGGLDDWRTLTKKEKEEMIESVMGIEDPNSSGDEPVVENNEPTVPTPPVAEPETLPPPATMTTIGG